MAIGASALGQLFVRIGADTTGLDRGIGNAKTRLELFGKTSTVTMQTLGKGAMAMSGVVLGAMGAIGSYAASLGATFEQSVTNAAAVAGGGLREFEQVARAVGKSTQYTATQAADAMYYFASAGWGVHGTMLAAVPAVNLAIGTMADMTVTSQLLASSVKAMGADFREAGHYADVYARAIQLSMLTTGRLQEAMKYAAPTGKALGWTIEQTTAAVAMFANLGLEGSQAGTNLRMAMVMLGKDSDGTERALHNLGLTFEEINPQTHDFGEIISTLAETKFSSLKTATELFGARVGAAMLALVKAARDGVLSFEELEAQLKKSHGTAEMMRRQMQDTVQGQFLRLVSAIQEIGLSINDLFKGPLKAFISSLADTATKIAGFIQANKDLVIWVGLSTAAIAALVGILGTFVVLGPVVVGVAAAIGAAFTVASAPIWLTIGAVVALIAIVGMLVIAWKTNLGHIQEYIYGTFLVIQESANKFGMWFAATLTGISRAVKGFVTQIWDGLKDFGDMVWELITGDVDAAAQHYFQMTKALGKAVRAAKTGWASAATDYKSLYTQMDQDYQDIYTTLGNAINQIGSLGDILDQLKAEADAAGKSLQSILEDYLADIPGGGGGGDTANKLTQMRKEATDLLAAVAALDKTEVSQEETKYSETLGKLQNNLQQKLISQAEYNLALAQLEDWRREQALAKTQEFTESSYEADQTRFNDQLALLEYYHEEQLLSEEEFAYAVAEVERRRTENTRQALWAMFDQYTGIFDKLGGVISAFGSKQAGNAIMMAASYINAFAKIITFFGDASNREMMITGKKEAAKALESLAAWDLLGAVKHGVASTAAFSAAGEILGLLANLPKASEGAVIMAHPNEAVIPFEKFGDAVRMWNDATGQAGRAGGGGGIQINNYVGDVNSGADYSRMLEDIGSAVHSALIGAA